MVLMDTKVFEKIADLQEQIVEDMEMMSSFPLLITEEWKDLALYAHLARSYQDYFRYF